LIILGKVLPKKAASKGCGITLEGYTETISSVTEKAPIQSSRCDGFNSSLEAFDFLRSKNRGHLSNTAQ
jgi:hypothetical protein